MFGSISLGRRVIEVWRRDALSNFDFSGFKQQRRVQVGMSDDQWQVLPELLKFGKEFSDHQGGGKGSGSAEPKGRPQETAR